jgi:hypothetical protein
VASYSFTKTFEELTAWKFMEELKMNIKLFLGMLVFTLDTKQRHKSEDEDLTRHHRKKFIPQNYNFTI